MAINLSSLPEETIEKYNLRELSQYGKVYIKIQKGMYGLPKTGILANELFKRNLAKESRTIITSPATGMELHTAV
jgi:hypothetical protein